MKSLPTSRIGIRFVSNTSIPMPAGAHLLFQFTTGGANGQPVNGDFPVPFISLGSTGGQIALTGKDQTLSLDCPASPDPTGAVVDYVGYGSVTCSEGTPAPSTTKALLRLGGGCTDGNVLSLTERNALVNGLISQQETRATVLRKIAEHPGFIAAEFNRAFVLMQYFGYLRRNPDDSPNSNFDGFDFWLAKLNQFGDYRPAEMVKAFLSSTEYRNRFGP